MGAKLLGDDVRDTLSTLRANYALIKNSFVLLTTGANDIIVDASDGIDIGQAFTSAATTRLAQIDAFLRGADVRSISLTRIPKIELLPQLAGSGLDQVRSYRVSLNAVLARKAALLGWKVLDLDLPTNFYGMIDIDGLHPNRKGVEELVAALLPAIVDFVNGGGA